MSPKRYGKLVLGKWSVLSVSHLNIAVMCFFFFFVMCFLKTAFNHFVCAYAASALGLSPPQGAEISPSPVFFFLCNSWEAYNLYSIVFEEDVR